MFVDTARSLRKIALVLRGNLRQFAPPLGCSRPFYPPLRRYTLAFHFYTPHSLSSLQLFLAAIAGAPFSSRSTSRRSEVNRRRGWRRLFPLLPVFTLYSPSIRRFFFFFLSFSLAIAPSTPLWLLNIVSLRTPISPFPSPFYSYGPLSASRYSPLVFPHTTHSDAISLPYPCTFSLASLSIPIRVPTQETQSSFATLHLSTPW